MSVTDPSLVLKDCPAAGSGVHQYLYYGACRCLELGVPESIAAEILRQKTSGCGRSVPDHEIRNAIKDARKKVGHKLAYHRGSSTPQAPSWPKLDAAKRALIVKHGIDAADLCDLSPS